MLPQSPVPEVTLSIVSHGQNALVNQLCGDLKRIARTALRLVLIENLPDSAALAPGDWGERVEVIANPRPRGFGANHNLAFGRCRTPYFCVCNPDIRLASDPFPALIEALAERAAAVAGPLVRNAAGQPEDSARRFPTPGLLLRKLVRESKGPEYPIDRGPLQVDWVAGMFMFLRSDAFRAVGGFDERYYLYYEDVDLCSRMRAAGHRVIFQPRAEVTHEARRGSRRDPLLMLRHAASLVRYLGSRGFR